MTRLGIFKYLSAEAWQGLEDLLFVLSVLSLTDTWCQGCIFKTFVLSFHGSCHLDDPSLFEAYIKLPVVTLEHNLKISLFESSAFFPSVLHAESA